jgi:hypothetical protein
VAVATNRMATRIAFSPAPLSSIQARQHRMGMPRRYAAKSIDGPDRPPPACRISKGGRPCCRIQLRTVAARLLHCDVRPTCGRGKGDTTDNRPARKQSMRAAVFRLRAPDGSGVLTQTNQRRSPRPRWLGPLAVNEDSTRHDNDTPSMTVRRVPEGVNSNWPPRPDCETRFLEWQPRRDAFQ